MIGRLRQGEQVKSCAGRPTEGPAMTDPEANRFSARAARYAKVGANVGGVAARFAAQQLTGGRTSGRDASNAAVLDCSAGRGCGENYEHSGREL